MSQKPDDIKSLGFEPVLTLVTLILMDMYTILFASTYTINGLAYSFLIVGWCVAGFLLMHLIWRMIRISRGKR